jgi:serine protease inhibitor
MPKFTVETDMNLNDVLQRMGLIEGFKSTANFSGISDFGLFISDVIQKAKIEVCWLNFM